MQIYLKMPSANWRPFKPALNMLMAFSVHGRYGDLDNNLSSL